MTSQTVLADAVDAVYDLLAADVTLNAITGLKVFDGPALTDRSREVEVWVGSVGTDDDDGTAAALTSQPADFGDERDEVAEVYCAIWAIGGSTDMRTRRRKTATAYDAIVSAVAGWNLASVFTPSATADVVAADLRQLQTANGAATVQTFTVRIMGYWS